MLTYQQGQYKLIEGPRNGGYEQLYKFAGENGIGNKIIVAERRWQTNPTDYCAGCPSRMQFSIYTWNGEGYDKIELGLTQNKYLTGSIDEILQKEPNVLNPQ